jgi:hypothetical protein
MPANKKSGNPAVRAVADKQTTVDLDARRAAVREAKGEHIVIKFGGREFHGPVEMPLTFGAAMAEMDLPEAARILFGDDGADFLALGPTIEDFTALMEGYGIELPESSGSPGFSMNTGEPWKPTSNASTG